MKYAYCEGYSKQEAFEDCVRVLKQDPKWEPKHGVCWAWGFTDEDEKPLIADCLDGFLIRFGDLIPRGLPVKSGAGFMSGFELPGLRT